MMETRERINLGTNLSNYQLTFTNSVNDPLGGKYQRWKCYESRDAAQRSVFQLKCIRVFQKSFLEALASLELGIPVTHSVSLTFVQWSPIRPFKISQAIQNIPTSSYDQVMVELSQGQVKAKSWPSHGQVMAKS